MSLNVHEVENLLPLIPLLPLFGAALNGFVGHRLPRAFVGWLACGSVLGAFVLALCCFSGLLAEGAPSSFTGVYATWMRSGVLSLDISLTLDHLSGVMVLIITGIGFLIHLYSTGYMSHEPAYARYFAYLNLFTFAMLVLVLGDSLPLMFVGWEGVGLCSYLLIGFWYTDDDKASAGKKAFVVNRIGDFGFIVAMLVLLKVTGTLSFVGLKETVAMGGVSSWAATGVCLMLLLGATGKSAQLPLYVWLPDAMAGPTPVSALIHAATMVTAGVYMVARLGFLFTLAPVAMLAVACVGACTALFAATIGTVQNDIKKVLAYSTVSQLGFMFIAAGVGAYAVALFHVMTHAFFKACLFLGSGSVIHGMSGEQDMRKMGGLWKKMPITCATFILATLAITGFPFFSGFISKDAVLWHAFASSHGPYAGVFECMAKVLWGVGVLAAGFTSFYMWRLVFMTFFSGSLRASKEVAHHVHESPLSMTVPLMVLAALSVLGGLFNWPHIFGGHDMLSSWLEPVVGAVPDVGHASVALELGLMGVSTAVALVGFVWAYRWYAKGLNPQAAHWGQEAWTSRLYQGALGKWFVDECYQVLVVRPLRSVSSGVLYKVLDRTVIDGCVNAVGWLARSLGWCVQIFQNGHIQRYLAVFVLGLGMLLYGYLRPVQGGSRPVGERTTPSVMGEGGR